MIQLNTEEAKTTVSVIKEALGLAIAPDTIKGLEVHKVEEVSTVIVITTTSLHAIGKDYFRQLVAKYKSPAPATAPAIATKPVSYRHQVMQRSGDDFYRVAEKVLAQIEKKMEAKRRPRIMEYNGYVIYKENYLAADGRGLTEYSAYKKGTNYAEIYRIARASLKALKQEIDN